MWRFTVYFFLGSSVKCVLHLSGGRTAVSTLDLTPSEKTIRGTCRNRTAGRLTAGCWTFRLQLWHPWLVLETSLVLKRAITWGRCVFTFTVSNQFGNPVWVQDRTFLRRSSVLLRKEYSVWPRGNAVKCHIMGRIFTDQFVYFYIYETAVRIISPVKFAFGASHVQRASKVWENHDLTMYPVITCIYLCRRIYASHLSSFSNRPSVLDQKPNWNGRLA